MPLEIEQLDRRMREGIMKDPVGSPRTTARAAAALRDSTHPPEPGTSPPQSSRGSGLHRVTGRTLTVLDRGTKISDRYVITDLISQGATSYVYSAIDGVCQSEVAIKVVRNTFGDPHERAVDRLQLELFVYQLAHSPHLPSLRDAGRLGDGSPYIVMDRVHGQTLSERLRTGVLSIPAVLELGQQLMAGLGAAHRHGIVHRDITPRNLLLEESPDAGITLKIIDFGICARERSTASGSSVVLGTPSYMAPEQIMGSTTSARSDLYSASVVLYEAVTGRLPFEGGSSLEILSSALHAPLLPPRVLRENCPIELERLLLEGLERDPDARVSSAEKMGNELARIVALYGFPSGADAFRAPASLIPRASSGHEAITERSGLPSNGR